MKIEELQHDLEALGKTVPSGSYFICGTKNTDIDFFTTYNSNIQKYLEEKGFRSGFEGADASFSNDCRFVSYRRDKYNVIMVRDTAELMQIELATQLCTALKLKAKRDRIFVFNTLRLGIVSDKGNTEL